LKRVPAATREFIRSELVFLAEKLKKEAGLSAAEARGFVEEMLTVSI